MKPTELRPEVAAAARSFFSSGDGRELLMWLRMTRPEIADFSKAGFVSDRQFDVSIGAVKGWEQCIAQIEKVFDKHEDDPLSSESMSLIDKPQGE